MLLLPPVPPDDMPLPVMFAPLPLAPLPLLPPEGLFPPVGLLPLPGVLPAPTLLLFEAHALAARIKSKVDDAKCLFISNPLG
jgi:hypothetical protein